MTDFSDNNVLARVKFNDYEHNALKNHALSYKDGTALASYAMALEWFLRLPPEKEHRFFYSSTKSGRPRPVWVNNKLHPKVEKLAVSSDQPTARIIYTATIKFLIENGYLI